jgi:hypothetical protein
MSTEPQYSVGEQVEKFVGDARYTGEVVSVYCTKAKRIRYVVEVDPQGFQMIVSEAQIRRRG